MKSKGTKALDEGQGSLLRNLLSALGKHDIKALENNLYPSLVAPACSLNSVSERCVQNFIG